MVALKIKYQGTGKRQIITDNGLGEGGIRNSLPWSHTDEAEIKQGLD